MRYCFMALCKSHFLSGEVVPSPEISAYNPLSLVMITYRLLEYMLTLTCFLTSGMVTVTSR